MSDVNTKNEELETIEIFQDAIVIYKDGLKELHDVLYIQNNMIFTGHILRDDYDNELFVCSGGIPKQNISRIEVVIKKRIYNKEIQK